LCKNNAMSINLAMKILMQEFVHLPIRILGAISIFLSSYVLHLIIFSFFLIFVVIKLRHKIKELFKKKKIIFEKEFIFIKKQILRSSIIVGIIFGIIFASTAIIQQLSDFYGYNDILYLLVSFFLYLFLIILNFSLFGFFYFFLFFIISHFLIGLIFFILSFKNKKLFKLSLFIIFTLPVSIYLFLKKGKRFKEKKVTHSK
jgi:hypothetical protein